MIHSYGEPSVKSQIVWGLALRCEMLDDAEDVVRQVDNAIQRDRLAGAIDVIEIVGV